MPDRRRHCYFCFWFCSDLATGLPVVGGVHTNFVCLLGSAQNHPALTPAALELEIFDHTSTHGNVRDLCRMELAMCPRSCTVTNKSSLKSSGSRTANRAHHGATTSPTVLQPEVHLPTSFPQVPFQHSRSRAAQPFRRPDCALSRLLQPLQEHDRSVTQSIASPEPGSRNQRSCPRHAILCRMGILDVKAAVDTEWDKLEKFPKVRSKKEVIEKALKEGRQFILLR